MNDLTSLLPFSIKDEVDVNIPSKNRGHRLYNITYFSLTKHIKYTGCIIHPKAHFKKITKQILMFGTNGSKVNLEKIHKCYRTNKCSSISSLNMKFQCVP